MQVAVQRPLQVMLQLSTFAQLATELSPSSTVQLPVSTQRYVLPVPCRAVQELTELQSAVQSLPQFTSQFGPEVQL